MDYKRQPFKIYANQDGDKVQVNACLMSLACVRTSTCLSHIRPFHQTSVCSFVVILTALLFHSPGSCHSEKVTSLPLEGKLTRTGLMEN